MKRNGLSFWIKYENKNADAHIRKQFPNLQTLDGVRGFLFMKPFEAGSNIELKELDDKILITAKVLTRIKESNFSLEAEQIIFEAGHGIKISSTGKDTLRISADTKKMEEAIFDFNKRLEVVEKSLATILKILKVVNS